MRNKTFIKENGIGIIILLTTIAVIGIVLFSIGMNLEREVSIKLVNGQMQTYS
jgi:hypothetical protein